ncbi:hypothetical protein BDZ97DRAFT_1769837 [Flammula alnicola]|nr:hypothetical protein BDZ97DRAFT_1769837 [Flammula alnicola]
MCGQDSLLLRASESGGPEVLDSKGNKLEVIAKVQDVFALSLQDGPRLNLENLLGWISRALKHSTDLLWRDASSNFKPTTIKQAFKKSGVYPINLEVFTDKDFVPSISTSTSARSVPASYPVSDDNADNDFYATDEEGDDPNEAREDDSDTEDGGSDEESEGTSRDPGSDSIPISPPPLESEAVTMRAPISMTHDDIQGLKRKQNACNNKSCKRAKLNVDARTLTSGPGRRAAAEKEAAKEVEQQKKQMARDQREVEQEER